MCGVNEWVGDCVEGGKREIKQGGGEDRHLASPTVHKRTTYQVRRYQRIRYGTNAHQRLSCTKTGLKRNLVPMQKNLEWFLFSYNEGR
jgi:AICAR transformylase/IMP cyclohydrolase PurH